MTLLEILSNGLDIWPYGELTYAAQDFDGEVWFFEMMPIATDDGLDWKAPGLRVSSSPYYDHEGLNASDYPTAIVTMKQWIKERYKMKEGLPPATTTLNKDEQDLGTQPKPLALNIPQHSLTARDYLSTVHRDWTNNYTALDTYAECNSIDLVEAMALIALASAVAKRESPEEEA